MNKPTQSLSPHPHSHRLPTLYTSYGGKLQHRHTHTNHTRWAQEIPPPLQHRHYHQPCEVLYMLSSQPPPRQQPTPPSTFCLTGPRRSEGGEDRTTRRVRGRQHNGREDGMSARRPIKTRTCRKSKRYARCPLPTHAQAWTCTHYISKSKDKRKMSLNYALGLLMYSCRFCSCKPQTKAASRARTEYGSNQ